MERIAWFTARTDDPWIGPTASLLNAHAPALTSLGRRYVSYGLPADSRAVIDNAELPMMLTDEMNAVDWADEVGDEQTVWLDIQRWCVHMRLCRSTGAWRVAYA